MDEIISDEGKNIPNFLQGKKSLKAMLEESETALKKNGGPTFLKQQKIVDVSPIHQSSQIQVLRDLINNLPGQIKKQEERMDDFLQEANLVLASIKAQNNLMSPVSAGVPLLGPSKMKFWSRWGNNYLILILAISIGFGLGVLWFKTKAVSDSSPKSPSNSFLTRPRSNLREGPSLKGQIITLVKTPSPVKIIRVFEDWSQVVINPGDPAKETVGWVHSSNLYSGND